MKKHVSLITALLLSMLLIMSVAACSEGSKPANDGKDSAISKTSGETQESDTNGIEYKDTIIFAHSADAWILNPHLQNGTNSEAVALVGYNSLLKWDNDYNVVGDLAESWEVADDEVTWTFNLKKGVKFHNGKEMTAHDFEATWKFYMNPDNNALVAPLTVMEDCYAKDDYTFVAITKSPYGVLERTLCDIKTAVLSAEDIEEYGALYGTTVESTNGTGPYKYVRWDRDSEIECVRFDEYFGEPAGAERLIFRVIPEASARMIALETGEIDITDSLQAEDLAIIEKNDDFEVMRRLTVNQRLMRFGCNDEIISNTKVRQAIVHAIDREAILEGLFAGIGELPTCSVSTLTFGYVNLGVIERDLELAKKLLDEAGYPDGFKTKIVTTDRYAKGTQVAEVIAAQLAEIGIDCTIEVEEWSPFIDSTMTTPKEKFDMPIFIMGGGYAVADSDGELRVIFGEWENETARRNYGFYENEEVWELLNKAAGMTDQVEREKMYQRVNEILYLEDPGGFWLYDQYHILVSKAGMQGILYPPNLVANFRHVRIPK